MAATRNAGLALGWVRTVLGASWDELYATAGTPVRPNDPLFVPHFAGERTPYLDTGLRGEWRELGLDHDRTVLLRSALEGVAHALRDAFDGLPGADRCEVVRLAGGGGARPPWRQLLADVLDRELHAVEASAASARGAALLAGTGVGVVAPGAIGTEFAPPVVVAAIPQTARELYADRLRRYRELMTGRPGPP
jgi:xylulokinase